MIVLGLDFVRVTGSGPIRIVPSSIEAVSICSEHNGELEEGQSSSEYATLVAPSICDILNAYLGEERYVPAESYSTNLDLRIYSVPGFPETVRARYQPTEAPTEYDWGLLGLQKETILGPWDKGDIPSHRYYHDGVLVCRRQFSFAYGTDEQGATVLTVTETPAWARGDDTWIEGSTKTQIYAGQRYNNWRSSARARIWDGLKTWLPQVLVAIGESADIPAAEAVSGTWFAAKNASYMALYLASGNKAPLLASLAGDLGTLWLDDVIPEGVLNVPEGITVREMIVGALR